MKIFKSYNGFYYPFYYRMNFSKMIFKNFVRKKNYDTFWNLTELSYVDIRGNNKNKLMDKHDYTKDYIKHDNTGIKNFVVTDNYKMKNLSLGIYYNLILKIKFEKTK